MKRFARQRAVRLDLFRWRRWRERRRQKTASSRRSSSGSSSVMRPSKSVSHASCQTAEPGRRRQTLIKTARNEEPVRVQAPLVGAVVSRGLMRAWCGKSMKTTSAPIFFAASSATYSGEYAISGYQTANRGGTSSAGAGNAGESQHIVVITIGRVDGDRWLRFRIDNMRNELVRFLRPFDEENCGLRCKMTVSTCRATAGE